eukprot:gnl/MRDRNA2_/MRDRNA2_276210_c0_seq1.p1 gnl/MRDRNA2_/MRDRNA2_276210_c0~~gnl/MRDRNA2_/MRDRNA2_276210_c0_seq1.p1  ORF type:complete len:208 (+),score=53.61 gnl/MRDRNA2_/MRDRNA2_276210_c0_seq1:43-624(+)
MLRASPRDGEAVFIELLQHVDSTKPAKIDIASAIDLQGHEVSVEDAFFQIKMSLDGKALASNDAKLDAEEPIEAIIPCEEIFFTQSSCSRRFSDGRRLEDTISELVDGTIDPLKHPKFVLHVIKRDGKLHSVDNRRLYCLKEFQKKVIPSKVLVKVIIHFWDPAFDRFLHDQAFTRFLAHNTSRTGGVDIHVK